MRFLIFFLFLFFIFARAYSDDLLDFEIENAKKLAITFEGEKARESTERIRKRIIKSLRNKYAIEIYSKTFLVDGISFFMEGKTEYARESFSKAIFIFPEIADSIDKDIYIPQKIKEFVKSIREELKREKRFLTITVVSPHGEDVFINGEKFCRTPCKEKISYGFKIICVGEECMEKFIAQDEIITFDFHDKKNSFVKNPLIWGVVGGLAITSGVIIFLSLKNKPSTVLKITIYE